jgi:hypothetical protein
MLIRGGGLLLERVGALEKLFRGGADFDDQEEKEKMKRQGWALILGKPMGAAGLCQGTKIALSPT